MLQNTSSKGYRLRRSWIKRYSMAAPLGGARPKVLIDDKRTQVRRKIFIELRPLQRGKG